MTEDTGLGGPQENPPERQHPQKACRRVAKGGWPHGGWEGLGVLQCWIQPSAWRF